MLHVESQAAAFGFVTERPHDHVAQVGEEDFLGVDRHGAEFDLRQIENVADEIEQIGARAVDGAGELDLLAGTGCRRGCRRAAGRGSGCC